MDRIANNAAKNDIKSQILTPKLQNLNAINNEEVSDSYSVCLCFYKV